MATAENDGIFEKPVAIPEDTAEAFNTVKSLAESLKVKDNLHVGLKDDLDRHIQVIQELKELNYKISLMLKHFNIVPILGDVPSVGSSPS